jgi:hypothetical protein
VVLLDRGGAVELALIRLVDVATIPTTSGTRFSALRKYLSICRILFIPAREERSVPAVIPLQAAGSWLQREDEVAPLLPHQFFH